MIYKGYVRGFGGYTPQQLEKMKSDLSLAMPLSMLGFCAAYYGKQEKRDPAIEELGMLDLLFRKLYGDPAHLAPIELMTNDACVAATYADMMQKRNALSPNVKTPCSLGEAFGLATNYLCRAGKELSLKSRLATLEGIDDPTVALRDPNLFLSSARDVGLRQLAKREQGLSDHDALLLLLSAPGEGCADYEAGSAALFGSPDLTRSIKQIRQIGSCGLLYELLRLCDGVNLSMPHMSRLGEEMPLSMLIDAYEGKHLLRVSEKDADALEAALRPLGLRAMRFAYTTSDARISVVQESGRRFSWRMDFLRALLPVRQATICLANEADTADAPILHLPIERKACKYLMHPPTRQADTYFDNEVLTSVAASAPQSDFFKNALDTALCAVLTLSVAGCHYSEQRLAISLTLPKRPTDAPAEGEGLSAVLGLYRLQAELGIPMIADRLCSSNGVSHPSLTAFATATGKPCPISLQSEGSRLYCIMPRLGSDGTYDFRELRKLLSYLSEQRNRGVLKSARILCRESVTDALAQMRTDTLSCRLLGDVWASEGALPLAILLESSEPIANAKEVARVMARISPPTDDEPMLSPSESIFSAGSASVTVLSKRGDFDAHLLCEALKARGARVHEAVTATGIPSDRLAQSILGVQTLIVCRNVSLRHSTELDFALDTLSRAGGRILYPNRSAGADTANGIALPDGLSNKMLDQICFLQK